MRKLKKLKILSDIARSGIARAHMFSWTIQSVDNVWPLFTKATEFFDRNKNLPEITKHKELGEELKKFMADMTEMKKYVCEACQGWGHSTIDGCAGSKYKFCVTNKIIDAAYDEATDKREFKKALGRKDKAPPEKMDMKMNSRYMERIILVKRNRAGSISSASQEDEPMTY